MANTTNLYCIKTVLTNLRHHKKFRKMDTKLIWEVGPIDWSKTSKSPVEDGSKRLTDLPEELIREILLRLSDYKDLINSGEAYDMMNCLLDEQHIWRQLCKYHFPRQQVRQLSITNVSSDGKVNWEQIFHILRKKFGLKEEYANIQFSKFDFSCNLQTQKSYDVDQ